MLILESVARLQVNTRLSSYVSQPSPSAVTLLFYILRHGGSVRLSKGNVSDHETLIYVHTLMLAPSQLTWVKTARWGSPVGAWHHCHQILPSPLLSSLMTLYWNLHCRPPHSSHHYPCQLSYTHTHTHTHIPAILGQSTNYKAHTVHNSHHSTAYNFHCASATSPLWSSYVCVRYC